MQASIAIIESEYLVAIGLEQCLQALFPTVEIRQYGSVEQCRADIERRSGIRPFFVHFFVNSSLLMQHRDFFVSLPQITIALIRNGLYVDNFPCLDVSGCRQEVIAQLLDLHNNAHHRSDNLLTKREVDVLRCVALGMINKEIADALCISINTVITHRQHISEKTHLRSVAGLTMYAVMNGYVASAEINQ